MSDNLIKILLIEDNPGDARLIRELLADEPVTDLDWVENLPSGLERLEKTEFDVLLLDLSLPGSHGLETFSIMHKQIPDIPILIMTGLDDKELALEAVQKGAQDYLVKGQVECGLLVRAIKYAIERKKIEKTLRNSEEMVRKILEFSPYAITVSDLNGKIVECNKATMALHGYSSKEDLIGKSSLMLIADEHHERAIRNLKRTMKKGFTENIEYMSLTKDGRKFPTEISTSAMGDISGISMSLVTIINDITHQKGAESLLLDHVEDLERTNLELKNSLDDLLERVEERQHFKRSGNNTITADIPEGIYLFNIKQEGQAYSKFLSAIDTGIPCLAIIRMPPARFQETLGRETEVAWLTKNNLPGILCIDPSDITRLSLVLEKFLEQAQGGVVLFEGIEYLLSKVKFIDLLNLIQFLNDKIAITRGSIFIIYEADVLEEKDLKHLQRECLPASKKDETFKKRVYSENNI